MKSSPHTASRSSRRLRRVLSACLVLALLGGLSAQALAVGPTAEQVRSAILIKALRYERKVASGSGSLVVAVVVPSSGTGAAEATAMYDALRHTAGGGVNGRSTQVKKIASGTIDQVQRALSEQGAEVVYVPRGLDDLSSALGAISSKHILVLCGDPQSVGNGCLMSVEAQARGSRLVLDPHGAERAGFSFDARLLGVSRVVR